MNCSRFRYGDIQSWWEVPSIAYFCSLFRTAFNLLDFDIEELEEALLTDGTEESASSLLTELIVRLLNGCLGNNDISAFNFQMYLRRLFRRKCQATGRYNPFNTDIDFQFLPLRTKVEILYALCDFRLDAEDVFDLFKNLEAESLRVEPLGWDDNYSAYWYFYGTRLYREDVVKKPKNKNKKKRGKESKKRSCFFGDVWLDEEDSERVWQVVCFTEEDWTHLTEKFSKATSKVEKELYRSLSQNFLPEIPRLFQEKERLQRKRTVLEQSSQIQEQKRASMSWKVLKSARCSSLGADGNAEELHSEVGLDYRFSSHTETATEHVDPGVRLYRTPYTIKNVLFPGPYQGRRVTPHYKRNSRIESRPRLPLKFEDGKYSKIKRGNMPHLYKIAESNTLIAEIKRTVLALQSNIAIPGSKYNVSQKLSLEGKTKADKPTANNPITEDLKKDARYFKSNKKPKKGSPKTVCIPDSLGSPTGYKTKDCTHTMIKNMADSPESPTGYDAGTKDYTYDFNENRADSSKSSSGANRYTHTMGYKYDLNKNIKYFPERATKVILESPESPTEEILESPESPPESHTMDYKKVILKNIAVAAKRIYKKRHISDTHKNPTETKSKRFRHATVKTIPDTPESPPKDVIGSPKSADGDNRMDYGYSTLKRKHKTIPDTPESPPKDVIGSPKSADGDNRMDYGYSTLKRKHDSSEIHTHGDSMGYRYSKLKRKLNSPESPTHDGHSKLKRKKYKPDSPESPEPDDNCIDYSYSKHKNKPDSPESPTSDYSMNNRDSKRKQKFSVSPETPTYDSSMDYRYNKKKLESPESPTRDNSVDYRYSKHKNKSKSPERPIYGNFKDYRHGKHKNKSESPERLTRTNTVDYRYNKHKDKSESSESPTYGNSMHYGYSKHRNKSESSESPTRDNSVDYRYSKHKNKSKTPESPIYGISKDYRYCQHKNKSESPERSTRTNTVDYKFNKHRNKSSSPESPTRNNSVAYRYTKHKNKSKSPEPPIYGDSANYRYGKHKNKSESPERSTRTNSVDYRYNTHKDKSESPESPTYGNSMHYSYSKHRNKSESPESPTQDNSDDYKYSKHKSKNKSKSPESPIYGNCTDYRYGNHKNKSESPERSIRDNTVDCKYNKQKYKSASSESPIYDNDDSMSYRNSEHKNKSESPESSNRDSLMDNTYSKLENKPHSPETPHKNTTMDSPESSAEGIPDSLKSPAEVIPDFPENESTTQDECSSVPKEFMMMLKHLLLQKLSTYSNNVNAELAKSGQTPSVEETVDSHEFSEIDTANNANDLSEIDIIHVANENSDDITPEASSTPNNVADTAHGSSSPETPIIPLGAEISLDYEVWLFKIDDSE